MFSINKIIDKLSARQIGYVSGLELSSSAIKFAKITRSSADKKFYLKNFFLKRYSGGSLFSDGKITNPEWITNTLNDYLSSLESSRFLRDISLVIPATSVTSRTFDVDISLSEYSTYKELGALCRASLGNNVDEVYFDYHLTPPTKEGKNTYNCFFVDKNLLEQRYSLIESMGFNIKKIEIDVFSHYRMIEFYIRNILNYPMVKGEIFAFLDLGYSLLEIVFFDSESIVLKLDYSIGWSGVHQKLTSLCDPRFEEKPEDICMGRVEKKEYFEKIRPDFFASVATHMARAMNSLSAVSNAKVEYIIVVGGMSLDSDLPTYITKETGIKSEVLNFERFISIDPEVREKYRKYFPSILIPMGVSLESVL